MASPKSDPASQFSSAAYILFYRRRSSKPLGGPRFEEMFTIEEPIDQGETGSSPSSRAGSPSGEGQRLEDSSRGFSSAYHGQEATHQAGNGGRLAAQTATTMSMMGTSINQVEDDTVLPSYDESNNAYPTMEVDDSPEHRNPLIFERDPTWSFGNIRASGETPSLGGDDEEDDDDRNNLGSQHGEGGLLSDMISYGGQPGTPDDDNDSMRVDVGASSDFGPSDDEASSIVIAAEEPGWERDHESAAMVEDVHEIRP